MESSYECTQEASQLGHDMLPILQDVGKPWGQIVSRNGKYPNKELFDDEIKIGRKHAFATIVVDHPAVSSLHCTITKTGEGDAQCVFLHDHSTNGTYVNGRRIGKNNKALMKSGDEMVLIKQGRDTDEVIGYTFYDIASIQNDDNTLYKDVAVGHGNARGTAHARTHAPAPVPMSLDILSSDVVMQPAPGEVQQGGNRAHQQQTPATALPVGDSVSALMSAGTPLLRVPARRLEDYDIRKELGKGAFATVRRCVHKATGNQYAMKIIEKKKLQLNGSVREFNAVDEARILMGLDHPNVIKTYDIIETKTHIHIVLELVNGGDLFDRIVDLQGSGFPEANAKIVLKQCVDALAYLHGKGIVHRDLKPENVLLKNPRGSGPHELDGRQT